ncbi:MAG: hypothetical protein ACI8P9_003810 [Parasphingorhabdus sp.]|jgi:uncharacterized protein (TIGR00369 family)
MSDQWQPSDPNYIKRVEDSFHQQQVMAFLGASLVEVSPGKCLIELPFRPELGQQNGFFHTGITSTISDSAGGYAGFTLMPKDSNVLTVEYKITLLRPAKGERLIAIGNVIKAGRNLVFTQVDVLIQRQNSEPVLCAQMSQTLTSVIVD